MQLLIRLLVTGCPKVTQTPSLGPFTKASLYFIPVSQVQLPGMSTLLSQVRLPGPRALGEPAQPSDTQPRLRKGRVPGRPPDFSGGGGLELRFPGSPPPPPQSHSSVNYQLLCLMWVPRHSLSVRDTDQPLSEVDHAVSLTWTC